MTALIYIVITLFMKLALSPEVSGYRTCFHEVFDVDVCMHLNLASTLFT